MIPMRWKPSLDTMDAWRSFLKALVAMGAIALVLLGLE